MKEFYSKNSINKHVLYVSINLPLHILQCTPLFYLDTRNLHVPETINNWFFSSSVIAGYFSRVSGFSETPYRLFPVLLYINIYSNGYLVSSNFLFAAALAIHWIFWTLFVMFLHIERNL